MKKVLIMTAMVLALAAMATAQEATTTTVPGLTGAGLKAGITLANLTGSDVENNKMKLGFGGGGFVTYSINDMFAIQPEVLFMLEGTKSDTGATVKLNLSYIEIPVLAKVTFQTAGNIKPSIFAGPQIGFLVSAKAKDDSGSVDVKDAFKSTNFGAVFGAGVKYAMGAKGGLTFDARYNLGLAKIEKSYTLEGSTTEYKPNVKTGTFAVFVGYSFL